jgi:uncharacterized protein YndB with AHSA1/START domain
MELGTLTPAGDGRWAIHLTRRLAHPVDKVWRAITQPEHLAKWFPSTIDGDRAAGAALHFRFDEHLRLDGEMLAFEPPHLMELRWGDDVLRFELRPEGDGTILELTDTTPELGKAARDAAGWHECLELLPSAVTLEDAPFELGSVWSEVSPRYQAAFGPEASTVGPPEDHDRLQAAQAERAGRV